jgi:GalNAc-alpha-(1->4)-GalNAc-alpha-(1->3)-diNAcBac-PP-undecaprenol alpha-1,4-N-acetyl-D-galactosaminyltransferase
MSKQLSICLVSPSLQMGGLERAMSNLGNYFNSKGYKVYYIVLYKFDKFYELDNGIELIEPDFNYDVSKWIYYLKLLFYIKANVKQCNPDTVLSFGDYHNALVLFALKGSKYPVYISDRSSPDKNFGRFFTKFKKFTYSSSKGVIAQTERAAAQKRNMLGNAFNITIIPNAIRHVNRYDVARENCILGVGRHHKVKGFDMLIDAFALLDTDWKLVLAGGRGPETDNLKAQAEALGVLNKITFLGDVKKIDKVYASAGIFVLSSRSEGFPNALCEAMAAGLPCVSFDIVAGPADIITNGVNGILVPPTNIKELAAQMQTLILNQNLRNSLGAEASKLQQELSMQSSGEKFLKFITSHLQ